MTIKLKVRNHAEDLQAIAEDVLMTRREADVCNQGECLYPTLLILAKGYLDALAVVKAAQDYETADIDHIDFRAALVKFQEGNGNRNL